MRRGLALLIGMLALAGCLSPSHAGGQPSPSADGGSSPVALARNATAPAPQLLTWYLGPSLSMGPANETDGRIALTGGADPGHLRDLLRFHGDPVATPLWVSNFTLHLIFDIEAAPWQPGDPIEAWFGYEDDGFATFPVTGRGPVLSQQSAGTRLDVRINETAVFPGGIGLPAGATPVFLFAVQGSHSPAAPLYLHVGGSAASHVHPVVEPWAQPAAAAASLSTATGSLLPDAVPAPGSVSPIQPVSLPAGAVGVQAFATATTPGLPSDLDLQVVDRDGRFLGESNGPMASEGLRLYAANLAALPMGFGLQVVDAGKGPAQFALQVDALLPG